MPAGNPKGVVGLETLCGLSVASQNASTSGDILADASEQCVANGNPAISIVELPTTNDGLTALKAGNVDALLGDSPIVEYLVLTAGPSGGVQAVSDPSHPAGFEPVFSGIGVLKSREGLSEAVRLAFQSIIDDGTYARLCEKYGLTGYMVDAARLNQGTE